MRIALATVVGLLLLCCGCSTVEPAVLATAGASAPATCTESVATPAGGRPASLATSTLKWFGASDLWVGLPDHRGTAQGEAVVLKFPWVTLQADKPTSALGAPQVTATKAGVVTPVPASSTASDEGADTAASTGTPAITAFWASSNDARPDTMRTVPAAGMRSASSSRRGAASMASNMRCWLTDPPAATGSKAPLPRMRS